MTVPVLRPSTESSALQSAMQLVGWLGSWARGWGEMGLTGQTGWLAAHCQHAWVVERAGGTSTHSFHVRLSTFQIQISKGGTDILPLCNMHMLERLAALAVLLVPSGMLVWPCTAMYAGTIDRNVADAKPSSTILQ